MRFEALTDLTSANLENLEGGACYLLDLRQVAHPTSLGFLDFSERKRHKSIVAPERADQFVRSRWATKSLLAKALEKPVEEISFQIVGEGRPQLPDSELDFNISHCEDWLLIGLIRGSRIGVDIELIRDRKNWRSLYKKVGTDAEVAALDGLELKEFYEFWALKEALLKSHGGGVFRNAKGIELEWSNGWKIKGTPSEFTDPKLIHFEIQQHLDFVVATCWHKADVR